MSDSLQPHGVQPTRHPFVTLWTAAHQVSLSFTLSCSLLKFMSIESVMPSNHLMLCHPLLLLPSIFPSTRVFSNESKFSLPKELQTTTKRLSLSLLWAAAKSLQSCPTLCNPIDGSPPGSIPGILQARTLEWVAISFSNASK